MDVTFLTPLAILFVLTAAVPLAVYAARQRRASRVRSALGLEEPTLRSRVPVALALAAIPSLLAVAATQPIVHTTRVYPERVDAQAFVVLDISRSMLASDAPGSPTRFERAREIAGDLRAAFPEVPIGIASLTDRLLPHVFPTVDADVFARTLEKAVGIERPPPGLFYTTQATTYDALADIPTRGYFPESARKRVLVVLTDGETRPVSSGLTEAFQQRPGVDTTFVHVWSAGERIYETGVPEPGYRSSAASGAQLARAAALVGGRVVDEGETSALRRAVDEALGEGETRDQKREGGRRALMPYVTLLALLPLGFLLYRRNL